MKVNIKYHPKIINLFTKKELNHIIKNSTYSIDAKKIL